MFFLACCQHRFLAPLDVSVEVTPGWLIASAFAPSFVANAVAFTGGRKLDLARQSNRGLKFDKPVTGTVAANSGC